MIVTVAILGLLIAILLPCLGYANSVARKTVCLTNLHDIGIAIQSYALDNDGRIPFGPKAPPMMTSTDLYPSTGAPTTLISLRTGSPVGLGLMLKTQLAGQPDTLFCPASDQPIDSALELAKVGQKQAQGSYYYRHASVTAMYDSGPNVLSPDHIRLSRLGNNRNGIPIRALVIDSQFQVPEGFAEFGILPRTHHKQSWANVLYSDGSTKSLPNDADRFTVSLDSYQAMHDAFGLILHALEEADAEY